MKLDVAKVINKVTRDIKEAENETLVKMPDGLIEELIDDSSFWFFTLDIGKYMSDAKGHFKRSKTVEECFGKIKHNESETNELDFVYTLEFIALRNKILNEKIMQLLAQLA